MNTQWVSCPTSLISSHQGHPLYWLGGWYKCEILPINTISSQVFFWSLSSPDSPITWDSFHDCPEQRLFNRWGLGRLSAAALGLANNEELVFENSKPEKTSAGQSHLIIFGLLNLFVIQQDTPSNMKLTAERHKLGQAAIILHICHNHHNRWLCKNIQSSVNFSNGYVKVTVLILHKKCVILHTF